MYGLVFFKDKWIMYCYGCLSKNFNIFWKDIIICCIFGEVGGKYLEME